MPDPRETEARTSQTETPKSEEECRAAYRKNIDFFQDDPKWAIYTLLDMGFPFLQLVDLKIESPDNLVQGRQLYEAEQEIIRSLKTIRTDWLRGKNEELKSKGLNKDDISALLEMILQNPEQIDDTDELNQIN